MTISSTNQPDRLSIFLHSIRFRLSLWFGLVLAVIVLAFSLIVYTIQSRDAYNQASSRLAVRISELDLAFRRSVRSEGDGSWLRIPGSSNGNPFTLRDGEVLVLANQSGEVAAFSGPVLKSDAEALALIAIRQKPSKHLNIYRINPGEHSESSTYLFISSPLGYEDRVLGWVALGQQLDPNNYLSRLKWTLIIAATATFLAALGGGYWLADRALKPVKTITRTAQTISENGLNHRLNIHSQDELGELAATFDQMLDRLQAAFERQRQFTADASHELRTPLTIIGLETGRALAGGRSVSDYQQALEVVQSENKFMTRLVEELLILARMDAGQIPLKSELLDLSDLVLEVVERYEPLAQKKGIRLKTGGLPELPVLGDRQTLSQAVGNLVDNAIKYSPALEGQWVVVETGISPELPPRFAIIKVSDNGPGIASEHLPHLFDRFYRVDRARSRNLDEDSQEETIPGSGLGLAIAQWIVQIHAGQIMVKSEPGQGTIFEILLPLPKTGPTDPRTTSSQPVK